MHKYIFHENSASTAGFERLNQIGISGISILKGLSSHDNEATILQLISTHFPLFLLPRKLYLIEIRSVYQKLWLLKCTVLKTFESCTKTS